MRHFDREIYKHGNTYFTKNMISARPLYKFVFVEKLSLSVQCFQGVPGTLYS